MACKSDLRGCKETELRFSSDDAFQLNDRVIIQCVRVMHNE
jgi:hypothetical protein